MDTTNLIAYLPFDESPTEDLCGNEWTATSDTLQIVDGALLFDNTGYISTSPPELGTQDFSVDWWEFIPSSLNSFSADIIGIDGNGRALGILYLNSNHPTMYLGNGSSWK